jgi:hypothetical protein
MTLAPIANNHQNANRHKPQTKLMNASTTTTTTTTTAQLSISAISAITSSFYGKKGVQENVINALKENGYSVSYIFTRWNFGTSGICKPDADGSFLLQVGCATGGRARNGHSVNACPVVRITL